MYPKSSLARFSFEPILAARKTAINSSRANLSLDLMSFFLQNVSLVFSSTSTFHLCISSVYFTVRRGDLLNLPKFYRASSVFWRAPTGKWHCLTDQSERAIYFCCVRGTRTQPLICVGCFVHYWVTCAINKGGFFEISFFVRRRR